MTTTKDETISLRRARPIRYFLYRNLVLIARLLLALASFILFRRIK